MHLYRCACPGTAINLSCCSRLLAVFALIQNIRKLMYLIFS